MKRLLKRLIRLRNSRKNHPQPLVTISLSKSSLISNLAEMKKIAPNRQIAPVLKSNAYGHGLSLIANELKNEEAPFFVVDSYFEAKALRNDGIKKSLLIIGFSTVESIIRNNLKKIDFTITSLDTLKELSIRIKKPTHIHLKIDTGMNRQGITISEIEESIKIIKSSQIILDGICSHFADADNIDKSFTNKQTRNWNSAVDTYKKQFHNLKYWHISATAGCIHKNASANLIRLGIGLYGLTTIEGLNLDPVLEMKTIVTGVKKLGVGDTVGYNNTFVAEKEITIATIPVGYNEGVDRRLSNCGFVKIAGIFCKIIGRVSMNITIIDVNNVKNIKTNDEVIVFSSNKDDHNSIENVAKTCNTISYEIAVHIPQHLKRIVIK